MLLFVALDLFWSYNFLVFQRKNKFYHKDRVTAETLVEKKEGVNMWFWFSIIALICWSGSDLFSKIGCADSSDKYSHLKMVTAVGAVMGLHAIYEIFVKGVPIDIGSLLKYLPVSALYILSMAIGYVGLRYIELSVSSPICNSSGALVAVLCIIMGDKLATPQYIAVALVCLGVIGLGFVEAREDEALRIERQKKANYKYSKSALAIILPLLYCLLDALGTFADSLVLETLDEDVANVAYELTFLVCGIVCFIYTKFIKKYCDGLEDRIKKAKSSEKYHKNIAFTVLDLLLLYWENKTLKDPDTEYWNMKAALNKLKHKDIVELKDYDYCYYFKYHL